MSEVEEEEEKTEQCRNGCEPCDGGDEKKEKSARSSLSSLLKEFAGLEFEMAWSRDEGANLRLVSASRGHI